MWRLVILLALILVLCFYLVFRPRQVLRFAASLLYSPVSPLHRRPLPTWAGYLLGRGEFEGPPASLGRLEDDARMLGYVLIAVPLALLVALLFL